MIKNGATTVATLQLAGDYTGDYLQRRLRRQGRDERHGDARPGLTPFPARRALPHDQTAGSVAGHRFIAAMAGFGGDSHGPVSVFIEAQCRRR